jgi:hypothetical protein
VLKSGDVADATDPPRREAGGVFCFDPLRFERPVAGAEALFAFNHPFVYAQ